MNTNVYMDPSKKEEMAPHIQIFLEFRTVCIPSLTPLNFESVEAVALTSPKFSLHFVWMTYAPASNTQIATSNGAQ